MSPPVTTWRWIGSMALRSGSYEHVCLVKPVLGACVLDQIEGLRKWEIWWWVTTSQLDMITYWHSHRYKIHVPHSYMYHTDISQYIEAYKSRGVRGEIEMEWSGCHCILPSSVPTNSNSEMWNLNHQMSQSQCAAPTICLWPGQQVKVSPPWLIYRNIFDKIWTV